MKKEILRSIDVSKTFHQKGFVGRNKKEIRALRQVALTIFENETYGLVGESGCGKSTFGKVVLSLLSSDSGTILFLDRDMQKISAGERKSLRKKLQMVFQNPVASLNPRFSIRKSLEEPLKIQTRLSENERQAKVEEIIQKVGLTVADLKKKPGEFSGGQCQRIAVARALILEPALLVLDEAVSALDVSVQSQILNLLLQLQREMKLSYLFISHDLRVIRHISDRIGIMYLGRIVEEGETDVIFENPLHPYTKTLVDAIPGRREERNRIEGEIPLAIYDYQGCAFRSRCKQAMPICKNEEPSEQLIDGRRVRCFLYQKETGGNGYEFVND